MKQNHSTFMFSQSHIQGQHQIADFCVRYVHVLQIQCVTEKINGEAAVTPYDLKKCDID